MKRENSTTVVWSSPRLVDRLLNKHVCMLNGDPEKVLFQLLRQEDLSMSTAWHLIWHGSGSTP